MPVQLDTTPYWIDSAPMPRYPRLERDLRVDVAVVGGGIAGLTTAYLLAAAGRSVALLERGRLVAVDTGHTTAHLTMVTDLTLTALVRSFGRDHAQAAWDAGLAAIAEIDRIARAEAISCDFAWVRGYLHAPEEERSGAEAVRLEEEARLAVDLGFDAAFVDDVPLMHAPGVLFHDQARFHPRKYLAGLARAIVARGGHVYEHSDAVEFSTGPRGVAANGHRVFCDRIVLATHTPLVGNRGLVAATLFQTKLAPYTSYVVAGRVPRNSVPDALFWDTADPYHYLRLERHGDHDLVIYGGEDHKTGQADDTTACYDRLAGRLSKLVPGIDITNRWSGQVVETADGLPYIGEHAESQFASTGFAGNGMTFGTLAGMMACDWVLGRGNPWSDLFEPGRKKIRAAWDYVKENKDYPYYMIRDRFAGAEARSLRAVRRGEGRIVELDGKRAAVYRDESGAATIRSAVCTHMGCIVDWNEAERTWDCPCHGSRFSRDGDVMAGPAESPLRAHHQG
jgi:glycine/D-amino acid oxidase-like deaminating enzyme/nitrite reductase/ring-hydroxylating ferredoxin subunit